MIFRIIPPDYLKGSLFPKEGEFTQEQVENFNAQGYNIYYFPNHPSIYDPKVKVDGSQVDVFNCVFVDMDLKDGVYTKETFLDKVLSSPIIPTKIVDSGRGIHAFWRVSDLEAMSYLKLQRRLCRFFNTDENVSKICQLMRYPGTVNTKDQDNIILCQVIDENDSVYTCEQLDEMLPPLTHKDDQYTVQHYAKTYSTLDKISKVDDKLPEKFCALLASNKEVSDIWAGGLDDRSKGDYRLGHIMFASKFTRDEARSVLVNSSKAMARSPIHRIGYADGIIDKIWSFEQLFDKSTTNLSTSVLDILNRCGDNIEGTRISCFSYLDNTVAGFRLGQVLGLVAGVGVGKTAVALNMFYGFAQNNPDLDHMFVALEQPENEIAGRWKLMCGNDTRLHSKVHIISNYDKKGAYRNLSLEEIKDYILKFQETSGRKVGCVVIDHIGVLKKSSKEGRQSIEDICHQMKSFAVQTQTFLVMQSQSPREKAGIGDLEINKDGAYGTVFFEAYVDFLVTMWQPLKRAYDNYKCPRVTAYKFCKIRHKTPGDIIQEDVRYRVVYNAHNGHLRTLTQVDETAFDFFNSSCVNLRKQDRKTEIVPYVSVRWSGSGNTENN